MLRQNNTTGGVNWDVTIPETNSSPLKIDPLKRRFLLDTTIFRCKLLVSGRVPQPRMLVKTSRKVWNFPRIKIVIELQVVR